MTICPICDAERFAPVGPHASPDPDDPWELAFELSCCDQCRLTAITFTGSDEHRAAYNDRFHDNLFQKLDEKSIGSALKLFEERASKFDLMSPGRILDVGSERGYFLKVMADRGWTVEGIEPLQPFAQYARHTFNVTVHEARLEEFEPDAPYDLITLWHVLEHLENPVEAVQRLSRFLSPRGILHVEVPNIDSLGTLIGQKYWMGFRDPTHRWFFRPQTMHRLAESAGLVVKDLDRGYSRASWYSLKRAFFGRLHGREHWRVAREGHRLKPSTATRTAYSVLAFYPAVKALSWFAGKLSRGESMNVWMGRER